LWLEAHEPGEPLNFLDHHIKCGNAIVGLAHADELEKGIASEAFKTLPGDEKEIASGFKKRNDLELKSSGQLSTFDVGKVDNELKDVQGDFLKFTQLPENTPEQIVKKEKAYQDLTNGKKWWRLKNLADLQVAQFFVPKTIENKEKITTHSRYITYLKQGATIYDRGASMAISQEKRFFHWFLEFPEVFQKGGFDCILGNPPFLGGADISRKYGLDLTNFLYLKYSPARNRADLVTYFVRRISEISKFNFSFISTNSISEGDTKAGGLDFILENGNFKINHAIRSMKWPGLAKLFISIVSFSKKELNYECFLNGHSVSQISSFLNSDATEVPPNVLYSNSDKVFLGCKLLGSGFEIDYKTYANLIKINDNHKKVLKPMYNGESLGKKIDLIPSNYVINFKDWDLKRAKEFPEAIKIVEDLVKPERDLQSDLSARNKWWIYARPRMEMYQNLKKSNNCFVWPRTSKYISIQKINSDSVFTDGVCVYVGQNDEIFSIIQSTYHFEWACKYSSKLKNDLRYSNSDAFETFPFPKDFNVVILSEVGKKYAFFRGEMIENINLGITKMTNLCHSKGINHIGIDFKDKQVAFLQKHLEKTPNKVSLDEAIKGIQKLRILHIEMDDAVLEAYGWHQDTTKWGKAIQLRHDFYEVDYLPENDRVRYTIHPEARKEVLKRLLQLNHERYAEEVAAGLHDKKGAKKESKETKPKTPKKNNSDDGREQQVLFPEPDLFNPVEDIEDDGFYRYTSKVYEKTTKEAFKTKTIAIGSVVTLKSKEGKEIKVACGVKAGDAQSLKIDGAFLNALLGKSEGDMVNFGNGFEVVKIN